MKAVKVLLFFILGLMAASGQQNRNTDFLTAEISLMINPYTERIDGRVSYTLKALNRTDSVSLDARSLNFKSVKLNGRKARFSYKKNSLVLEKKFKPGKVYNLEIRYSCTPEQAVYFLGWHDSIPDNEQIWTQGQGKYSSHWVPSFDDMREKVEFDLEIGFDKAYQVIANGKLANTTEGDSLKTWQYKMANPMSSYLLAFVVGKYSNKEEVSKSGVPITLCYQMKDSLKAEPTYRYTREIFDFMENEIGLDYPWQNYKQVPVRDFLYAGMENTTTTIFSDSYLIDSTAFRDKNYINVNAHELAHQWFGNLVTETDAASHWLHEGFASYYAWLAQKEVLGEDSFYWMLYDKTSTLLEQDREGHAESLLDGSASSLTFYDKGGLALMSLRTRVGEEVFRKGMKSFLTDYGFLNATVSDFMGSMEMAGAPDLERFKAEWLDGQKFQGQEVIGNLRQTYPPIDQFFKLKAELTSSAEESESIIRTYWDKTASSEFRKRIIQLYHKSLSNSFLKEAFATEDLTVRQALSILPGTIREELLPDYESLLRDKSYITIENALYKLWVQQPEKRMAYLDLTEGISGFPDRNIRQLWLLLAILTRDYKTEAEQIQFRKELFSYTAPHFSMEVRQLAFSLIGELFPYTKQNLKDLVNAAVHPAWQFRQFARTILENQLMDDQKRAQLELILPDLNKAEYEYLSGKLKQE